MFPRRGFLQVGALGWTGVGLPAALASAASSKSAGRPKSCILLYMDGGPSHIDLFDMKPDAPQEIRGPFRPIASSVAGVRVCEHLPQLAQRMHLLTLVRSLTHDQTVHDPAVYQMLTGYPHLSTAGGLKVEPDDAPHMAAAFQRIDEVPAVMPKAIETPETMQMNGRVLPGQNGGFLGPTFDPLRVEVTADSEVREPEFRLETGVSLPRFRQRERLLTTFNDRLSQLEATDGLRRFHQFQRQALDILAAGQVSAAFDLAQESPAMRDRYGRFRQGQATLLARRLVEAGARFVTVYWGHEDQDWADGKGPRPANNPWDTHRNHFPLVQNSLLPRADQCLSALLDDLDDRGLLDDTLVVWMGEFGRTPRITSPWASRDHWPFAFSVLLAGAGVHRGFVYGATDKHAAHVTQDPVTPADLSATIFSILGVDPRAVVLNRRGLPHSLSTGRPINPLLSS